MAAQGISQRLSVKSAATPVCLTVAVLGMALILAVGITLLSPTISFALTRGGLSGAGFTQGGTTTTPEQDNTYVNNVQGYSVKFQSDKFGVEEYNDGAGRTTFYLLNSVAKTKTSHGSNFTVNYMANWDGNPSIDQYFEEILFSAQMSNQDSFMQMTASPYEILYAGPVALPTVSWTYYNSEIKQYVLEIRAIGVIEGKGCVYFGASMVEDDVLVIGDALGQAVGSFKINPGVSGGKSVTWKVIDAPANTPPASTPNTVSFTTIERTDGWSYIIKVPEDWAFIEYGGMGETTLIDTFDFYHPEIRMTYWGSQDIPGSSLAAQLAGVPIIMESGTVTNFIELLPALSALADQNGQLSMPDETRVLSVEILDVDYVSAVTDALAQVGMAGTITDEAIVKARMILDDGKNTEVIALIYATVAAGGLGDFVSYSVMNVYGIFAPASQFNEIARALVESGCGQYTLHETYMQRHEESRYDLLIYANSYQQWHDYILENY